MLQLDREISELKLKYENFRSNNISKTPFADFPLSQKTLQGLSDAHYVTATEIQQESIVPALLGKSIVAVAETGSGKTLAFLIPVLEHLYVNKWSRAVGGLAALIISPTRELAYQLFETLRKIGKYHDFSAGLIIGGKNLRFERNRMDQCNILICTPGRLLQHMDENPLFNADSMEILVLDEADRCLDMGFESCLDAIIKNLPLNRQILLFSATRNSVEYLKRLNLQNPVYVGKFWQNRKENMMVIPERLKQNYVVVELEKKVTMLWSFIKNHLKQKIVVFLSSCKQVKYIYEIFCKLRPGISLLALYGTLNQDRRISIYNEFFKRNHGVLFATDIASRGLDFPDVNWVVQLDCPEDVTQYTHRAGRSARNKTHGESLLVLMPSEETAMVKILKEHQVNLRKIEIDPKKLFSPDAKLKAFCAQNPELKLSAQRAFIAYIKSVFLMKNKDVFDVKLLNFENFAQSLGLITAPRVRFLERYFKKDIPVGARIKINDDTADDFLRIKRVDHPVCNDDTTKYQLISHAKKKKITKVALAKKSIRKNTAFNQKRRYDDKGHEITDSRKVQMFPQLESTNCNEDDFDINSAKSFLNHEDKYDKERFKEMIKSRHKKLKEKRKKIKCQNAIVEGNSSNEEMDISLIPDQDLVYNNPPNECFTKREKSKDPEKVSLKVTEDIASQLLLYT